MDICPSTTEEVVDACQVLDMHHAAQPKLSLESQRTQTFSHPRAEADASLHCNLRHEAQVPKSHREPYVASAQIWQRDSSHVYLKINVLSESIHEKLRFQTQVDMVWTLLPAVSGDEKEEISREKSTD